MTFYLLLMPYGVLARKTIWKNENARKMECRINYKLIALASISVSKGTIELSKYQRHCEEDRAYYKTLNLFDLRKTALSALHASCTLYNVQCTLYNVHIYFHIILPYMIFESDFYNVNP